MRLRTAGVIVFVLASAVGIGSLWRMTRGVEPSGTQLPTGKIISPQGTSTDVGSYPANMAVSPDGKFVVVTNTGFKEQLSVLDSSTGALVSKVDFNDSPKDGPIASLYYGLAFDKFGVLYASNGPLDLVTT